MTQPDNIDPIGIVIAYLMGVIVSYIIIFVFLKWRNKR